MSIKFSTIPSKRLIQGITSASSSFYINNILGFDGITDVAASDLGTQHYISFRNDTGTIIEIMEIDPATISTGPITILRRGLSFYGDRTTETTALKLDWPANTVVQFGTDIPQIFQYLKEYIDSASIVGAVPASTTAAGIVVEASQAEVNAFTDTKVVGGVTYKLFAPLAKLIASIANKGIARLSVAPASATDPVVVGDNDTRVANASETNKGISEEATDAEVAAGTATGGTGAKLFVTPAKLATRLSICGDGSDGNVTISSPTTLTRDMYYDTLTVNDVLTTDGYLIYCKTAILGTGTVQWGTPNNGAAASGINAGAGATSSGSGRLKSTAGGIGGNGGNAGNTSGNGGTAGTSVTSSPGVAGRAGGNGGGGTGGGSNGSGGAAGAVSVQSKVGVLALTAMHAIDLTATGATLAYQGSAGSGGGGGGTGNSGGGETGGGGGGGGAGGGGVFICAKSWGGTFTIKSIGGAGGAGGAAGSGNCSGGGGGGGGSGGWSLVVYQTKTWTGSYVFTGGAGGAAGSGSGGGNAGTAGATGVTGTSYEVNINTLTR